MAKCPDTIFGSVCPSFHTKHAKSWLSDFATDCKTSKVTKLAMHSVDKNFVKMGASQKQHISS